MKWIQNYKSTILLHKIVVKYEQQERDTPIWQKVFSNSLLLPGRVLRIQWRLIFANFIRCSRLRLWVGYFMYFKLTPMFLKVTSAKKRYFLKMCHLRHRLRIFLIRKKIIVRFQDIQVFVFLTIPWFTKSVTSWWVSVHKTGCIFEYIFWTTTH